MTHRCKIDKVEFKPNIIGKSKVYKQIVTRHGLKFLDLINYVPAKTSLDNLVKSYKLSDEKGFFPYSTLARADFAELMMTTDSTTYDLFEDDLTRPPHRVKGHILEKDWMNYTSDLFRNTTQPVVFNIAMDLAKKSVVESTDENTPFKASFLKEKSVWLKLLGFNSIDIQKPRTLDTEDIISLKSSYMQALSSEDSCQRRTHFHWLNPVERKKPAVASKVKNLATRLITTGIENLHQHVVGVWKKYDISSMHQYLAWYNKKDVEIMHPLIDAMQHNYRNIDPSCQLFVDSMSLPNIARYIGYKDCEKNGGVFFLAKGDEEGEKFERVIRRNLNGGPSIIFNRGVTANITKIEGTENIVQVVKTYDANALYPKCMQSWLPVGNNVHVYKPDENGVWEHTELGKSKDSYLENLWLETENCEIEWQAREEKEHYASIGQEASYPDVKILSYKTAGRVPRVGHYEVDGLRYRSQFTDAELIKYPPNIKGIAYEFLGNYYHGHPSLVEKFRRQEKRELERLMMKRYVETFKKFQKLLQFGYVIKFKWEQDFKNRCSTVYDSGHYIPPFTQRLFLRSAKTPRKLSCLR